MVILLAENYSVHMYIYLCVFSNCFLLVYFVHIHAKINNTYSLKSPSLYHMQYAVLLQGDQ